MNSYQVKMNSLQIIKIILIPILCVFKINCEISVIDINDILNEKYMPVSMFLIADRHTLKNHTIPKVPVKSDDGTLNMAFSTMKYHRCVSFCSV